MATSTEMLCSFGFKVKTAAINGDTWVVFDEELWGALQHPYNLRGLLPAHDVQTMDIDDQRSDLITERLFYQMVVDSIAAGTIEFRNWVASKLHWHWHEATGDPQGIHNADRIQYAPNSVMGAIQAIANEYISNQPSVSDQLK